MNFAIANRARQVLLHRGWRAEKPIGQNLIDVVIYRGWMRCMAGCTTAVAWLKLGAIAPLRPPRARLLAPSLDVRWAKQNVLQ